LYLHSARSQYNIQKETFANYEKVLLFPHTAIIADYKYCTNIQIHRRQPHPYLQRQWEKRKRAMIRKRTKRKK